MPDLNVNETHPLSAVGSFGQGDAAELEDDEFQKTASVHFDREEESAGQFVAPPGIIIRSSST